MSVARAKTVGLGVIITLCLGIFLAAQGPLTNLLSLRGRTDANGYLIGTMAGYTAPDGPLTALSNIRGRTDANGYLLMTTSSSGSSLFPDGTACTAAGMAFSGEATTGFVRGGSGDMIVCLAAQRQIDLSGTSFGLGSDSVIGWSASAGNATAAKDTTIRRSGIGEVQFSSVAFAALGTPANGSFTYCTDCTEVTPATCPVTQASCICAGSGSGAFARRVNSTWYCTF